MHDFATFETYDFAFRCLDEEGVMCRYDALLSFSLEEAGPIYLVYTDLVSDEAGEEAMYASVEALLDSITDADYKAVCRELLRRHSESFRTIPAAKSVHHGFLHGLLMHTGNMMQLADFLAGMYADTVDRSLLLAGTFAHDLQKEREFRFSALGLVTDYSVQGQLLGHLVMGAQEIADIAKELDVPEEKSVLLQHLVLSHHGEPEFGAAVRPVCAESELLSYIDMIDSRMEIYREVLGATPLGGFSDRVFALDGKKLYHHE